MRVLIALIVALVMNPWTADACSCAPPEPACTAVWDAHTVFSGTVLRIKQAGFQKVVTFRVDRLWRTQGDPADTLQVTTGMGAGDCGFPFLVGGEYLVFAQQNVRANGAYLSTGICARTRPLEDAADDLTYLSKLESGGDHSRIYGRVLIRDARDQWTPLARVTVDLHRGDDIWSMSTDDEGRFEFVNLPPALYHVFARDYLVELGSTSARINGRSTCGEIELFVKRPPGP